MRIAVTADGVTVKGYLTDTQVPWDEFVGVSPDYFGRTAANAAADTLNAALRAANGTARDQRSRPRQLSPVVATVLCWLAGLAFVFIASSQLRFDRAFGRVLRTQYEFEQRLPSLHRQSEEQSVAISRWVALGLGVLLLVLGIGGTIALIR